MSIIQNMSVLWGEQNENRWGLWHEHGSDGRPIKQSQDISTSLDQKDPKKRRKTHFLKHFLTPAMRWCSMVQYQVGRFASNLRTQNTGDELKQDHFECNQIWPTGRFVMFLGPAGSNRKKYTKEKHGKPPEFWPVLVMEYISGRDDWSVEFISSMPSCNESDSIETWMQSQISSLWLATQTDYTAICWIKKYERKTYYSKSLLDSLLTVVDRFVGIFHIQVGLTPCKCEANLPGPGIRGTTALAFSTLIPVAGKK